MVIDYKRLNDNTKDDGYDIPTKEYLLGKIKDCTIFSKFDCKLGFWKVKMHPNMDCFFPSKRTFGMACDDI